jgi:hypothetical protein
MEIKGVVSGRFENDVFGAITQGLKGGGQRDRNLGLVWAEKNLDLERPVLEQANVFRLDVLKIDKDEVGARSH